MAVKAYSLTHHRRDVLIIGAGGAGLRAALAAVKSGASVSCISKVHPLRSHTSAAQGGINAALGAQRPDDWRWHMYDTVRGSDWLGDQDAIARLCRSAPGAILELESMGMPFSRDANGRIYQRAYGGQSTDFGKGPPALRACAVADRTGRALLDTLYAQTRRAGVQFFLEFIVVDLLFSKDGACTGAMAWELESGDLHCFQAGTTILATGGAGQMYAQTTASFICTGDGGGMALRAGLPLQDMEFVQFHPTGLYGSGLLITEGARGEGAYLINGNGERFMTRYAPNSGDLASRDVICRAMMQEIAESRGCGPMRDHMLLVLSHLGAAMLEEKLPAVCDIARRFARVDPAKEPIPVLPTVHYTMGGIPTDSESRVVDFEGTAVPGLMAIGEAASTSIHGANRLGCNSLLELVVFGELAGRRSAEPVGSIRETNKYSVEKALGRLDQLRHGAKTERPSPADFRQMLQRIMMQHAGISRDAATLSEGIRECEQLRRQWREGAHMPSGGMIWNLELAEALEFENLIAQAGAVLHGALAREESRGAHYRKDFVQRDDAAWMAHSLAFIDKDGNYQLSKRAVRMAGDDAPVFAPEERKY